MACFLFLRDATEDQVAAVGRWASLESMRRYLRGVPALRISKLPLTVAARTLGDNTTVRAAALFTRCGSTMVDKVGFELEAMAPPEQCKTLFWKRGDRVMHLVSHAGRSLACCATPLGECQAVRADSFNLRFEDVCASCLDERYDFFDP